MSIFRREWLFALVVALICLGLGFLDLAPHSPVPTSLHARGHYRLATFAGSMLGVLLTCGLAVWFAQAFRLHGAVRPLSLPQPRNLAE